MSEVIDTRRNPDGSYTPLRVAPTKLELEQWLAKIRRRRAIGRPRAARMKALAPGWAASSYPDVPAAPAAAEKPGRLAGMLRRLLKR